VANRKQCSEGYFIQRVYATGFTLLEVLIAMAIFSLISLTSFALLNTVINSDEISQRHSERLIEIQRAWLIIERDLMQLTQRTIRIEGEKPVLQPLFTEHRDSSSGVDSISFVRAGWRNPGLLMPRSDIQPVNYYLDNQQLIRQHFNFVDAVEGQEPIKRVLLNDVEALQFEFYIEHQWKKELNGQFPSAIAVIIKLADIGEIRRAFLLPELAPASGDNSGVGRDR
jgi:general secretion pathway protein J